MDQCVDCVERNSRSIRQLVAAEEIRISEHGYEELAEEVIYVRDLLDGMNNAIVVEDYPSFAKGPAVLVLQFDRDGRPVHVVWGIPKGFATPAVLVTAYRPDPTRWNDNFTGRRQ